MQCGAYETRICDSVTINCDHEVLPFISTPDMLTNVRSGIQHLKMTGVVTTPKRTDQRTSSDAERVLDRDRKRKNRSRDIDSCESRHRSGNCDHSDRNNRSRSRRYNNSRSQSSSSRYRRSRSRHGREERGHLSRSSRRCGRSRVRRSCIHCVRERKDDQYIGRQHDDHAGASSKEDIEDRLALSKRRHEGILRDYINSNSNISSQSDFIKFINNMSSAMTKNNTDKYKVLLA